MHLSHLTRLTVHLLANLRHKCDAYNPFEGIDIQGISLGNTTTWRVLVLMSTKILF